MSIDATSVRPTGTPGPVPSATGTAPAVPPPPRPTPVRAAREEPGVRPVWWVLTPRGIGALVVGVVLLVLGLVWRYSTLLGIAVALLLALVVEVVLVSRRVRLTAERVVTPPVVERHAECMATVTLSGRPPRLVRSTVNDRVGRHRIVVSMDEPTVRYRVPTLRRGLMEVGPLSVNLAGTFGLAARSGERGGITHVRVLPRSVPARGVMRGRRRSAVGADESLEHGGTDLVGLHEYVPGDDLRRLHWATSARSGILMVRDDAEPSTPHLTVVLDDAGASYADHGTTDTDFEDAVEVAFALCRAALRQNQPVHLLSTSGAVDVVVSERIGAAEVDAQRLYAALAEVQASEGGSGSMRLPKRALDCVAVVSGSEATLNSLEMSASRGATGVILIVDHTTSVSPPSGGSATILRGPRSIDLTQLWDRAVS
ncbi:DUF58 domain-containing protein [Mariniluteicoccus flavus]